MIWFPPPQDKKDEQTAEEKERYTIEEARKFEDAIVKMIEGDEKTAAWSEAARATVYAYLHGDGMDISKARQIRRKKGLTGA